ncbi:hypothetical protein [Shewanella sp. GD03713]|uniref:hypothetical protein n=1 Tax=Shewanella sp. GD03713 TaxID=2975372 RepID=UPI00244A8839|nr:hypothetical protein [Shewanella sp. GD03713]MDH1472634.1 hypothetical protein [Shewanella sp. GD03713]
MDCYAYFFGNDQSKFEEFKKAFLAGTPEQNIFIEELSDDESRPKLELLAQSMSSGDKLSIESLEHIGSTMNDVILSLESFSLIGISLHIHDNEDSKFIDSIGGLNLAPSIIKSVFSLQQRVVRARRHEGIRKAMEADSKLYPWEAEKKKYRGKVGNSEDVKLKAKGLQMRGHNPTQISELLSISRGSVYNYIREMDEKQPCAITAYKYLLEIDGFKLLPHTTYKSVVEIVVDVISYLASDSQKTVRDSVSTFTKLNPEIATIGHLNSWLNTNDINEIFKLNGFELNGSEQSYFSNLVKLFTDESIDDIRRLSSLFNPKEASHIRPLIRTLPDFGETGLNRLTGLLGYNQKFKDHGIDRLINKCGLNDNPSARFLKSDSALQSLMSTGLYESWELTICHFVD